MAQGFKKYLIIDKTYHITTVQLPVFKDAFIKKNLIQRAFVSVSKV